MVIIVARDKQTVLGRKALAKAFRIDLSSPVLLAAGENRTALVKSMKIQYPGAKSIEKGAMPKGLPVTTKKDRK